MRFNSVNQKKVEHLTARWNPPKRQVERVWEGILIGDAELEELKAKLEMEERKKVPVYGGADISDNLRALLWLPPGMTTYEDLDETKFNADLETMMVKQRWEERIKEERGSEEWTKEWEVQDAEASKVKENNTVNFAKKKDSSFPTYPRITLPKPNHEKREVEMRNLTGRLKDVFKKYKDQNCNEKGRVKADNITKEERIGLKEARKS